MYIYVVFLFDIYIYKIETRTISQGMFPDGPGAGTGHGGRGRACRGHGRPFSGWTNLKPLLTCPGQTLKGVCLLSAPEHGPRWLQAAPLLLPLSLSPTGQPRGSPGWGSSPIKSKSLKSLSGFFPPAAPALSRCISRGEISRAAWHRLPAACGT